MKNRYKVNEDQTRRRQHQAGDGRHGIRPRVSRPRLRDTLAAFAAGVSLAAGACEAPPSRQSMETAGPVSVAGTASGGSGTLPAVSTRVEPASEQVNPRFETGILPLEGSGVSVWGEGFEEPVVAGLDGEPYPAYSVATIHHVQRLLRARGLYAGPVNGFLDLPTMQAIGTFQEASQVLQVCGVPTPRTRLLLERGSHTA